MAEHRSERAPARPRSSGGLDDPHGRKRVTIDNVQPAVDGGAWPVKRVVGETLVVTCDLVADGHDEVGGRLTAWHEEHEDERLDVPLHDIGGDRWQAEIPLDRIGRWWFTVEGWIDHFASWRHGLEKKVDAGQDVSVDLLIGAELLMAATRRAGGADARAFRLVAEDLADEQAELALRVQAAMNEEVLQRMAECPDHDRATRLDRALPVQVERDKARFSAWYEFFPRSTGPKGEHGTLRTAEAMLPYIAGLGFDIAYLPPIHPIGRTFRKGPNNSLQAGPDDPGSPWAVGGADGGHMAVHPALGTLDDLHRFCHKAEALGLEVALDIAFQASPDHPWVTEHPEWFKHRPDGTIQYAENPPKKYQDIYPLDFESSDWRGLWEELSRVFRFWIDQGITIFRVDNPHTKSLRFWAWCIRDIQRDHPEAIFLAEAFTAPKLMYALAKRGFTQSYTYFTWRESAWELQEYLDELTHGLPAEVFRPNFWPNTPDILPEHLTSGRRAAFVARAILAGTLSSNYGLYGPAYELMEHQLRPGSGEYLDNEKYELKDWDLGASDSLRHVLARLNRIRRAHPALQQTNDLVFHPCDNDHLLCYSKRRGDDVVLVVVCLDFDHRQGGHVHLDLGAMGLAWDERFVVHDLLGDGRYTWQGPSNYVEIDPWAMPAHLFAVPSRSGNA